jgi:hypothetical protein
MHRRVTSLLAVAILTLNVFGCAVGEQSTDGQKVREALPTVDEVRLKDPTGPGSSTQSLLQPGLGPQDTSGAAYAKYYKFTRDLFDGVNFGTGAVLGFVWIVVNVPPTTVVGNESIWGPGSEALAPVEWRFRATEQTDGEVEYFLEGHPKTSKVQTDYAAVLHGVGYAQSHPKHRQGWFELDFDTSDRLDPARLRAPNESGTAKVTYALASFPVSVTANLRPSASAEWFDIVNTEQAQGGGGTVDISASADLDPLKNTKLEDVKMHSRWVSSGAGRADVVVSGGDLPSTLIVRASECWSSNFSRCYYTDNASIEPTFGEPDACAFPAPQY